MLLLGGLLADCPSPCRVLYRKSAHGPFNSITCSVPEGEIMLRTVTPRDSSRDISLSRLFYLKSFPHCSTFSAHRTSPHFSVSFRTFPCYTFPCLPLSYYGYSPVLTYPCLLFHSPWFNLSFPHSTLVTMLLTL